MYSIQDDPPKPPPIGQGLPDDTTIPGVQDDGQNELTHLLWAVAVWAACLMGVYLFGIGLALIARIFRSTGFRARDMAVLWIPGVNAYFVWRAMWRFTAHSRYWEPRSDLNTVSVFGPARTLFVPRSD